jgi:methyl-accepting chemotaxis protein
MFRWIMNRTISLRITVLAGLSVTGMLAILLTYLAANSTIEDAQATADRFSRIALLEEALESESLQIRRPEKDFLLLRDPAYVDLYDASMDEARSLLGRLETLSTDFDMNRALAALGLILPNHERQFHGVVDDITAVGLDESVGLQGALRGAVHDIEDLLKTHTDDTLEIKMLMMRRHEKDFIMRLQSKYIDRIGAREEEFLSRLEDVRFPDEVKAEIREKLQSYVTAFRAYARQRTKVEEDIKVLNTIYSETKPHFTTIQQMATSLHETATEHATNAAGTAYWMIVTIALAVIAIAILIGVLVVRTTTRPVSRLEAALRRIADGDYETDIPGTEYGDEVGSMARVAEVLRDSAGERVRLEAEARQQAEVARQKEREETEQLAAEQRARDVRQQERAKRREIREARMSRVVGDFESSIGAAVGDLERASNSMRDTAGDMVEVSDTTGRKVNAVSEASNQMQDNVSAMASAIEEFAASISEVNQQMQNANSISREAVNASERGTTAIGQLSESSRQIEDVVKLINDIAEQTNLLALNATIEAARAGDAGKGFAVVASEVKSLANQTAKATEQVTAQITDMQSVTSTAVQVISSMGEANERLNNVMLTVSSAVEQQQATTNEISRSVQYTSEGTQRVTAEIHEVADGAEKTGVASANVMQASEQLEQLAQDIKARVELFLNEVGAVANENITEDLNAAA